MAENQTCQVDLKPNQIDWLEEMAQKHSLPNRSKALRCLITFAMEQQEQEAEIFETIRCTNC